MGSNPTVRTHLRLLTARVEKAGLASAQPFVTISRQPGAGGRALAEAVVAEADRRRDDPRFEGWRVYDEVELQKVACEPLLRQALGRALDRTVRARLDQALRETLTGEIPVETQLLKVFFALRAVACLGKAVIVGRGGVCLTRDLPLGIHVRLVASEHARGAAIGRHLGLSARESLKRLKILSDCRSAFVRDYFARRVEDPQLYDACWNTEAVPLESIARWICDEAAEISRARDAACETPPV